MTTLMGGLIALPQWLMLRQRVPRAGWWILANAPGWGWLRPIAGETLSDRFDMLAVVLVPAVVSGIGLYLLLDEWPRREAMRGRPGQQVLGLTRWSSGLRAVSFDRG